MVAILVRFEPEPNLCQLEQPFFSDTKDSLMDDFTICCSTPDLPLFENTVNSSGTH